MSDARDLPQIEFGKEDLREMIVRWVGQERAPAQIRVITDTSDFFRVDYDDVVILGRRPYLIRNNEREGRFGIDDEQKFWVKRAVDLADGSTKIIKLVMHERFTAKVGGLAFECVRSPKKEARILDLVRGHPHFMQGFSVPDEAGNITRIIDYIHGKKMSDYVLELGSSHEDYFLNHFPPVLEEYVALVQAIKFLHDQGQKHGDIRRDHIIKDKQTGLPCWIDFDFNYLHKENLFGYDLFGLGNILVYLVGRGDVTAQELEAAGSPALERLTDDDMNIIFHNRVVNLRKVYPYLPESLNMILLHFSTGANIFYDDTGQLLNDLYEARHALSQGPERG